MLMTHHLTGDTQEQPTQLLHSIMYMLDGEPYIYLIYLQPHTYFLLFIII